MKNKCNYWIFERHWALKEGHHELYGSQDISVAHLLIFNIIKYETSERIFYQDATAILRIVLGWHFILYCWVTTYELMMNLIITSKVARPPKWWGFCCSQSGRNTIYNNIYYAISCPLFIQYHKVPTKQLYIYCTKRYNLGPIISTIGFVNPKT